MILDFYGVDELCEAKRQLMSDVISLNLDIDLPHIPERRDGDSKAVRIVDDLFTAITFLDENLKISDLPCYAADSPDAMPSPRLYEGDLSILMKVIEKMQNEIKELNIAMAAVAKDIRDRPNGQATQQSTRTVTNSDTHTGVWAGTRARNPPSDGVLMTSQDSRQLLGHPRPVVHERSTHNWASAAVESTPIPTCSRYSVLAAATDDDDDDDDDTNLFMEVKSRRSAKRPRHSPTQLKQQQQLADSQPQRETQQQIQGGQRRRGRVMLTGKCGSSSNQRFAAAKKIVKKPSSVLITLLHR